jgi:hypothetical protein
MVAGPSQKMTPGYGPTRTPPLLTGTSVAVELARHLVRHILKWDKEHTLSLKQGLMLSLRSSWISG